MKRTVGLFIAGAFAGVILTGGIAQGSYRQYQATASCVVSSGTLTFNSGDGTLRNSSGSSATLVCPWIEGDNFAKGSITAVSLNFDNHDSTVGTSVSLCVGQEYVTGGTCDSANTYTSTSNPQTPSISVGSSSLWRNGSYAAAYPYISITVPPTSGSNTSFVRGYRITI